MKITMKMILSEVAGQYVAVPVGADAQSFHGVVRLNESGKCIWEGVEKGLSEEQIAQTLAEEFEGVDLPTALAATKKLLAQLREEGIVAD